MPLTEERTRPASTTALSAGIVLTLVVLAALVADHLALHGIADRVRDHYAPHGTVPDPNLLFAYLYATGTIGVLTWFLTVRGAARRRPWAAPAATAVLLAAFGGALFNLLVSEYGERILPAPWALLTLVPCLAGAVAVVLLWKERA
ncbi:hypothetical protein [Nocardiopsis oceani]